MTNGAIYLLQDDQTLVAMHEAPYDSEDLPQALLARYPELLAGELVDPRSPRRWLLVKREAGIPGAETSPDRWAVDHLLLELGNG
jgi:hypothetical protein